MKSQPKIRYGVHEVIEYRAISDPFAHGDDSVTAIERDHGNGIT